MLLHVLANDCAFPPGCAGRSLFDYVLLVSGVLIVAIAASFAVFYVVARLSRRGTPPEEDVAP